MQEDKGRRLARTLVEVAKDDPNLQQQQGSAGGLGAIVAAESVSPGQLDGVGQQQQGSAGGLGAIVAAESVSPGQLDGGGRDRAANVLALLLDLVCDLMQYVPNLAPRPSWCRRRSRNYDWCWCRRRRRRVRAEPALLLVRVLQVCNHSAKQCEQPVRPRWAQQKTVLIPSTNSL